MTAQMHKIATKPAKNRGAWLRNPKKPRPHEHIGGGFFVFRRGDDTGRIRPGHWPFEHATLEAAESEACRLAAQHPGCRFDVLHVYTSICDEGSPPAA